MSEDDHVNGLVKVNDNVPLRFSTILSCNSPLRSKRARARPAEIIVADVELISALAADD